VLCNGVVANTVLGFIEMAFVELMITIEGVTWSVLKSQKIFWISLWREATI
jgi:hypothetical protein